jgi:hypothetical protein
MTNENSEVNIQIPKDKKAIIRLCKSGLSTYIHNVWVVISCQNVMGIFPGTMIPEQDIMSLHAISDLDVILDDASTLEKINPRGRS